jgi:membrane fusion protein, macrolide-specific efflux system
MTRDKYKIIGVIILILISAVFFINKNKNRYGGISFTEIRPSIGDINLAVSTTGVIKPQNRLQVKPSISGRIEAILVKEGDLVKQGDVLVWMSSTDRAALVDAAKSQGDEAVKYWEEVYKKTPLISPIDGEVIVRPIEPGQTVTTADAVLVLSDRLIVSAQFDETDIGTISTGQKTLITLDAYPDIVIMGKVDRIAYESELVNNVTIYNVDVLPEKIPEFFRSGMSTNVEVIQKERKNILIVPVSAVDYDKTGAFIMVKDPSKNRMSKKSVETGLNDGTNVEIVSGLSAKDIVVMENKSYILKKSRAGTNPFMPSRDRKK